MSKLILGIAGEIASGKGTVTNYIVNEYQAGAHRFSTMLRDILRRLYLEISRENLQNLSTILRQNFGEDTLSRAIAEDVKKDAREIVVIDGVRRLDDIKYLKKLPGFKLIYVEADIETRYERIIRRNENSNDQNKSFEEFSRENEQESEQQIKDLKNYADFVIDNNGEFKDLYKQVDKIVKK